MKSIIQRNTTFQGDRKIGFDANTLVAIIDNPKLNSSKIDYMFEDKDIFYIHKEVYNETVRVLKRPRFNYYYSKKKVDKFLKRRNIKPLKEIIPNFFLKTLKQKCKENKVSFHSPDINIVADYKVHGINKIYSGDDEFLQICRVAGIDSENFLKLGKKLDKKSKDHINRFFQRSYHK